MTFCALAALDHRLESSALLFSSASRSSAVSQSKMPPQQGEGLGDGIDELLGFGAHRRAPWWHGSDVVRCDADIGCVGAAVNRAASPFTSPEPAGSWLSAARR